MTAATLRITEIFLSLQGETTTTGVPTVFVRLTGCPLRCQYCDTAYAFTGGEPLEVEAIVQRVLAYRVGHVTVTGGEPLAQPNVHTLMALLCDAGLEVSLETSGALDVAAVDARVRRILDLKTPGSGEVARNRWQNVDHCTRRDEVKFVICDRTDYEWARLKVEELALDRRFGAVLFSPSATELPARTLADWIVADGLPVRLQIQLHKLLWGDEAGR